MADSATTRNRLRKQSLGSNLNVWGDPYLNDNFDLLDFALDGQSTIAIPGTSTTLTSTNYGADEARSRVLIFTGTATSNGTAIIPGVQKIYHVINNATLSTYTLTIKTASGVGATLPAGYSLVQCDATDTAVRRMTNWGASEISNVGAATAATSVARFNQVTTAGEDRSMAGYFLNSLGTASAAHQAANKGYVDSAIANVGTGVNPGSVKISVADSTAGFIGDKLRGTGALILSTDTAAGTNLTLALTVGFGTGPLGTIGTAAPGTATLVSRIDHQHDGIGFGRHTLPFVASGLKSNTTNGASAVTAETPTNKCMIIGYDYDTATVESAQFDYAPPKSWNLGGLTAKFLLAGVGTGTGAAVIGIDALAYRSGQPIDGAFVGTGTFIGLATVAVLGTSTYFGTPETGTFIAAGTAAAEDFLKFRVRRISTDAGDTFGSDIRMIGGRIYFTINAPTDA